MEYEQIKNWLKDNGFQDSGLRTDKYNLYLSDILYHYSKKTFQQLQNRINELEAKCKSEYQRGIEDGKIIAEHGTIMYQE